MWESAVTSPQDCAVEQNLSLQSLCSLMMPTAVSRHPDAVCFLYTLLRHCWTATGHTATYCTAVMFYSTTLAAQCLAGMLLWRANNGLSPSGHACRWMLPMRTLQGRKSAKVLHCKLPSSRQMRTSLARNASRLCRHSKPKPGHVMSNLLACVLVRPHKFFWKLVRVAACLKRIS